MVEVEVVVKIVVRIIISALTPRATTHAERGDTWAEGHMSHSGGVALEQPHMLEGEEAQE